MIRVIALICRLSPRPDGSYEGVDDQISWGRKYAARVWPGVPIEVFADRGLSAARDDVRPEYDRFRQWVRDGRVLGVWAVEQSRVERREIQWFEVAAELDAAGIEELHTDRDGIVRVMDEVAGVKAVLNAAEVRKMKRRQADTLAANAARGIPHGGKPFGYTMGRNDAGERTWIQVPQQAAAIRQAAEWSLSGWSDSNIANTLRERGVTGNHRVKVHDEHGDVVGTRPGRIVAATVRGWLANPVIAGYIVHKGQVVGRGNWDPILDEATWQALQARRARSRAVQRADGGVYEIGAAHRGWTHGRKYLLGSGFTRCGVCDAPLTATNKQFPMRRGVKRNAPYLVCHPSRGGHGCVGVMYAPVEQHVLDELWRELASPEFLDALADDSSAERHEQILRELSARDVRRRELATMWARQELTTEEWQAARGELDDQVAQLRGELVVLPAKVEPVDVAQMRDAWPDLTLDEQREFIGLYIDSVVVHRAVPGARAFNPARVEIVWRTVRR